MNSHPRYLPVIMVALLMLAAFVVGYQTNGGRHSGITPVWASLSTPKLSSTLDDSISLKPVQLFQEALTRVETEYVDPVTKTDELTYAAIRGMLHELKDPYTRFMDPTEYKEFNSDTEGHFAGIGATLKMTEIPLVKPKDSDSPALPTKCPVCGTNLADVKSYHVTIVEPLPGSPAKAAGLQPDDFIMKINDLATEGLTLSEAADKIRGPEGTQVTLTIMRKGVEKPLEVKITRANIEVPATETKMLDGNIGYLRLFKFNEKTFSETKDALNDFNKKKIQGLVLDLRSNPGGLLTECIRISSLFLPEAKSVIVSTKGRAGKMEAYNRIGRQLYDGPMVVLVNQGSASASEILSGALKDYSRAPIIGERTFGKALVQTVMRLSSNTAMAITTAHYYTPGGHDVGKKGVAPDVVVELEKGTKELNEKDNQAQAALKILKEEMAKANTK
ncbi:MAG: S41 family peptidase [Armatimonadota bacterium]